MNSGLARILLLTPSNSIKPKIDIKDVFWKSPINWFVIAGKATLKACGISMKILIWYLFKPRLLAASIWLLGIDCYPPRISSAIYAETKKVKAITALQTRSISKPTGRNKGINNCPKKSTEIRGTALITSI